MPKKTRITKANIEAQEALAMMEAEAKAGQSGEVIKPFLPNPKNVQRGKRKPRSEWSDTEIVIPASKNDSRILDKVILPEQLAVLKDLREQYKQDLPRFAAECLTVMDRDSPSGARNVPCVFTDSQNHIHNVITGIENLNLLQAKLHRAEGLIAPDTKLPVHTVVLKARKVMASTYFRARAFWKNEFNEGHNDLLMAHEKEVAQNLNEMVQRFHRGWTESVAGLRSKLVRLSDTLIEWEHDSRTFVKTAGSKSGGASQGFTYHYLQLSELSRYADGTTEMASATTAAATYREIHIESTARGDNEMKAQWDHAMWLADVIAYVKAGEPLPRSWNRSFRVFWAWWQDKNYRVQLSQIEREYVQKTLDLSEVDGMDKFGWNLEQVQWRRNKLSGECRQQRDLPPLDFFKQEYPSDPDEAFVSKGRAAFDKAALVNLQNASDGIVRQFENRKKLNGMPYFVGALVRDKKLATGFKPVEQTDIRGANLVLWNPPEHKRAYVIGADPAEGLEHSDDSVVVVYDRGYGVHLSEVARYISKASGEETAEIVYYLHKLYNDAYVVGERNNGAGATMCLRLVRLGCHMMFHHKNVEEFSDREDPESFTAGFHTSIKTKKMNAETMALMLRDGQLIIRHPDAISQALSYQTNDKGKLGAPAGKKDDCVSADMLACFGHQPDVAPPVWTNRQEQLQDEYNKLTPEQQLNLHYKNRIAAVIEGAKKRNDREVETVNRARMILKRSQVLE